MSSEQDKEPNLFAQYNGTGGYVERPASKQRATREAKDGTLSRRAQSISQLLLDAGKDGLTWKQVGERLRLHHGQASGALSNMHKAGVVFMLRQQRDRCHPYVHADYRIWWDDSRRFDNPAKTRAGERNDLVEHLLDTLETVTGQPNEQQWQYVMACVDKVRNYEQGNL
jgi:hypothetical protein